MLRRVELRFFFFSIGAARRKLKVAEEFSYGSTNHTVDYCFGALGGRGAVDGGWRKVDNAHDWLINDQMMETIG